MTRVSPSSAGCWLEGSRGWRASGVLVKIAADYDMPLDKDDAAIVEAYLAAVEYLTISSTGERIEVVGCVTDQGGLVDQAETYLNDNVAPEGYQFGWHEGEFYLMSDKWWDECL